MINNKILGLIGLATKAGKIVFGTDACIEAVMKKKIKLIIVATDASDRTKINFKDLCDKQNVKFAEYASKQEISKSIGKENKSVIGLKDINFSNEILKNINGGEIIG